MPFQGRLSSEDISQTVDFTKIWYRLMYTLSLAGPFIQTSVQGCQLPNFKCFNYTHIRL